MANLHFQLSWYNQITNSRVNRATVDGRRVNILSKKRTVCCCVTVLKRIEKFSEKASNNFILMLELTLYISRPFRLFQPRFKISFYICPFLVTTVRKIINGCFWNSSFWSKIQQKQNKTKKKASRTGKKKITHVLGSSIFL